MVNYLLFTKIYFNINKGLLRSHYGTCNEKTQISKKRVINNNNTNQTYSHTDSKAKLVIIVRDIGGENLSLESQFCLSLLSDCDCVSIVATMENLDTPTLWDSRMLARFHWSYEHVPTYDNHKIGDSSIFLSKDDSITSFNDSFHSYENNKDRDLSKVTNKDNKKTFEAENENLNLVFETIGTTSTKVFMIICEMIIKQNKDNNKNNNNRGVKLKDIFEFCKSKSLLEDDYQFKEIISELSDQQLIGKSKDNNDKSLVVVKNNYDKIVSLANNNIESNPLV